ncbi:MAG: hypothetical protein ACRD4L_08010, partial [Pyrinomonadaceae bacterium]
MKSYRYFLLIAFLSLVVNPGAKAQTVSPQTSSPSPQSANNSSPAEDSARRVARARALAAAGNLSLAASDLEAVIKTEKDELMREVSRVLLIGVYLELSDYVQAQNILDQSFAARATNKESSLRAYFTLAGQLVNTVRMRLDRYRAFGLNVSDSGLPPEGTNDLNRLRQLLEHVTDQAKEITEKDSSITGEAAALLEDTANLRLSLARDSYERALWRGEVTQSRERLVASDSRISSWSRGISRLKIKPSVTPTNTTSELFTTQPSGGGKIQPTIGILLSPADAV